MSVTEVRRELATQRQSRIAGNLALNTTDVHREDVS